MEAAPSSPPRPRTEVGFTVGIEPEPQEDPGATAGTTVVPGGAADGVEVDDDDEYDSDDWDFDEEYWSDEDEDDFGHGRRSLRGKVKSPAVLKKRKEKKKHKDIMEAGGVEWQPNKTSKNCQLCDKKFTIKVRRHHCRRCGGIFCATCSAKSLAREGQTLEPMRACDTCVAEVEVQPMFAWLSRRQAIPKTAEEVRSALVKVLQFSTNAKMQTWLKSPYTHM